MSHWTDWPKALSKLSLPAGWLARGNSGGCLLGSPAVAARAHEAVQVQLLDAVVHVDGVGLQQHVVPLQREHRHGQVLRVRELLRPHVPPHHRVHLAPPPVR